MKILWNLLCHYNNIYKREKKVQTEDWKKKHTEWILQKKKKKNDRVAHQNDTVDEQCKNTEWILLKYCSGIAAFHKTFIFSCGWSRFYILLFYKKLTP